MKLGAPGRSTRVGKPPGVENSEVLSQTRLMDLLLGQEHVGHKGDTAVETPGGFLYMQRHGQHSMSNFILVATGSASLAVSRTSNSAGVYPTCVSSAGISSR